MAEHARRLRRRARSVPTPFLREEGSSVGDEALDFAKWFMASKYRLMGSFYGELSRAPETRDHAALQTRYCRALQHGERVQRVRGAVTVLLALGVVAAAAASVAALVDLPAEQATVDFLERIAAVSASATVLLVGLRLALDRYLERVDVTAAFIGMQLATARRA